MERKGKDSESRKYSYVLIGYFVSMNRKIKKKKGKEKGKNKVAWQPGAAFAIVRPHSYRGRSLSHTCILCMSTEQIVGQC